MTRVIYGSRQSGRTTQLIKLCESLNKAAGHNCTVILAKDREDAFRIKEMATDMGYKSMPFPVTFAEARDMHPSGSRYKNLLIDDIEIFLTRLLYSRELFGWNIEGFTISEEFINGLQIERLTNDGRVSEEN